jgi:hypothetical protein
MKRLLMSLLGLSLSPRSLLQELAIQERKSSRLLRRLVRVYADREFNVSLWGTYLFTGNN